MGTQHTPPPDDDQPVDDTANREDLGIPEDGVPIADDPTGYVADANPEEILGRRMRRVTPNDLQEAHNRYAGDKPMFGPGSFGDGPKEDDAKSQGMPGPIAQPDEDASSSKAVQQEARRLMPSFLEDTPAQPAPAPAPSAAPGDGFESPFSPNLGESTAVRDYRITQATAGLEFLMQQQEAASARGDHVAAEKARDMAENLANGFDVDRMPKTSGRHPALKKLLSNLGLEKIENVEIDWGGSKWMFAPTNSRLDVWVGENLSESGLNIAALMLSSALIGLDGVPIYNVLGIPLDVEYSITDKASGEKRSVDVALYRKFCDCGIELEIKTEECPNCKKVHNTFDIPTELRLKCAEVFYAMLEDEFGAYEELAYLLDMKQEVMKDRQTSKEELFPLAMPSRDLKMMDTSPSGDA